MKIKVRIKPYLLFPSIYKVQYKIGWELFWNTLKDRHNLLNLPFMVRMGCEVGFTNPEAATAMAIELKEYLEARVETENLIDRINNLPSCEKL